MSFKTAMQNKLGDLGGFAYQKAKDLIPRKRIQEELINFQKLYGTGFKDNLFLVTFDFPQGNNLSKAIRDRINPKILKWYGSLDEDVSLGSVLQNAGQSLLSAIPGSDIVKSVAGGYLQKRADDMAGSGFYWYGYAKSVKLPAQTINGSTVYSSMNIPVTKDRQNVVMTLYDDQQSAGYHFWRAVQDFMFETTTMEMHYFNEYACDIHIDILDTQHSNMYTYVFYNAYANGLPDMNLNSDGGKSSVTFDLTFMYDTFTYKYWDKKSLTDVAKGIFGDSPIGKFAGKAMDLLVPQIDPEEQAFVVASAIGNAVQNVPSIIADIRYGLPKDAQDMMSAANYNTGLREMPTVAPDRMIVPKGLTKPSKARIDSPTTSAPGDLNGHTPLALLKQKNPTTTITYSKVTATNPDRDSADVIKNQKSEVPSVGKSASANYLQQNELHVPETTPDQKVKAHAGHTPTSLLTQKGKSPTETIAYAQVNTPSPDKAVASVISNQRVNQPILNHNSAGHNTQALSTSITTPDKNTTPSHASAVGTQKDMSSITSPDKNTTPDTNVGSHNGHDPANIIQQQDATAVNSPDKNSSPNQNVGDVGGHQSAALANQKNNTSITDPDKQPSPNEGISDYKGHNPAATATQMKATKLSQPDNQPSPNEGVGSHNGHVPNSISVQKSNTKIGIPDNQQSPNQGVTSFNGHNPDAVGTQKDNTKVGVPDNQQSPNQGVTSFNGHNPDAVGTQQSMATKFPDKTPTPNQGVSNFNGHMPNAEAVQASNTKISVPDNTPEPNQGLSSFNGHNPANLLAQKSMVNKDPDKTPTPNQGVSNFNGHMPNAEAVQASNTKISVPDNTPEPNQKMNSFAGHSPAAIENQQSKAPKNSDMTPSPSMNSTDFQGHNPSAAVTQQNKTSLSVPDKVQAPNQGINSYEGHNPSAAVTQQSATKLSVPDKTQGLVVDLNSFNGHDPSYHKTLSKNSLTVKDTSGVAKQQQGVDPIYTQGQNVRLLQPDNVNVPVDLTKNQNRKLPAISDPTAVVGVQSSDQAIGGHNTAALTKQTSLTNPAVADKVKKPPSIFDNIAYRSQPNHP